MNEDIKDPDANASDKVKLAAAILLIVGGIAVYYVLGTQPGWQRWLAVVGGLVGAVLLFSWSQYGRNFWRFMLDSRIELRKIVWPTRQDTGMTTLIVFVFVLVTGVFFWLLDLGLAWVTRAMMTGQGG